MKIFLAEIYWSFLLLFGERQVEYRYHRNENVSSTNSLLAPFGFKEMKVKHRYHSHEIISGGNLLVVHLGFDEIQVKYRYHKNENIFAQFYGLYVLVLRKYM